MSTFKATNTETGATETYVADAPRDEHRVPPWQVDTRRYAGRRHITKNELIDLLEPVEYIAILTAAKQSVQIEAWVKKLDYAATDADGNSVDLDSDTMRRGIRGLEMAGLIAVGRAEEILNG